MREAINENPVAQAVVIGVLLLAAAVLLLTQMKGSGHKSADTASTSITTPNGGTATVSATADQDAGTVSATVSAPVSALTPATGTAASVPAVPFEAGPGLPSQLVSAHDHGKTIVLLIQDPKGIDDKPVTAAVDGLKEDSKLAVYVTDANHVAKYARVTQGVGLSQVPALVVVSPLGGSGGSPKATVSYGFRGAQSVRQAVRDAVYRGPTLGYDPG